MRPVTIVLLVAALGSALLTTVLVKRYLANQAADKDIAASHAKAMREVLVAVKDLPPGRIIEETDLAWQPWPADPGNHLIVRGGGEDVRARYVGAIARTPFVAGEPLRPTRVFRQDGAGIMSGILSPGMRAMTIEVDKIERAVGGFIAPNDRVDFIVTYEVRVPGQENAVNLDTVIKYTTETVLTDLRVLAIDQNLVPSKEAAGKIKSVTVEVSQKEAELLALGLAVGRFHLALRSLARVDGVEPKPKPKEAEKPDAVALGLKTLKDTGAGLEEKPNSSYTTDAQMGIYRELAAGIKGKAAARESAEQKPKPSGGGGPSVTVYRGSASQLQNFAR